MNNHSPRGVLLSMETKSIFRWFIVCVFVFNSFSVAQVNRDVTAPALRNQLGRGRAGTVPPTTYSDGLITSPNPIDNTGNLIVTGNVGGGRHFRGVVPYNAVTDFGGRLGEGTLDEFLRYSSISSDYYRGGTVPFYSQTGTVSKTVPGLNVVRVPTSPKVRASVFDLLSEPTTTLGRTEPTVRDIDIDTDFDQLRHLPVSAEPAEVLPPSEKERQPRLSPEE